MARQNSITGNRKMIYWVTQTAIFIAVLIVVQFTTRSLGLTLVTGSLVNLILIVATMTVGPAAGVTVALLAPITALLVGHGPLWIFIPFIALGNLVFVLLWHFIGNIGKINRYAAYVLALVVAAAVKFAVIYLCIVKLAVPVLLHMSEPQASIVSAAFSFPQLITAGIGGVIAILIIPPLKKLVRN